MSALGQAKITALVVTLAAYLLVRGALVRERVIHSAGAPASLQADSGSFGYFRERFILGDELPF